MGNLSEKLAVSAAELRRTMLALSGGVSGATAGAGAGSLARARFEDKLKDKRDRTPRDKLLAMAPLLGFVGGGAAGALYGRHVDSRAFPKLAGEDAFARGFSKAAALLSGVKLKPHQERSLARLDDPANGSSLLAAHPTGSGKTLTSIAAFEKLKAQGRAKRAIVVVPAGLRDNYIDGGVKKFTNSSANVYGPKGERKSLNVGDKSTADYNVVSYELFRDHHDQLLKDTGADTLIMDEVHKVRDDQGSTYNKLREIRPKFKQAITLTGSIVNNEPADVVPLLDVTFSSTGHKLVNKKFFDRLFVQKDAKKVGWFSPKVEIQKKLKNKPQLAKYLGNMVDYVPREEVLHDMPEKVVEDVEVPMTQAQKKLYDFTLSSVDPITRWKIKNNIPVGQKEAKDAFSKLLKARQLATDPAVLDKTLAGKNPGDYSPKIRRVVDDLKAHLAEHPENRVVIYHNLLEGGLNAVEQALKAEGIPHAKFIGAGNEGVTAESRSQAIRDFNANKQRVLLLSSAGAQGLDLKHGTMMQMLEGHYNPEMIHQAESRLLRIGALAHRPEGERKVLIKRYMAVPEPSGIGKLLPKADKGIDHWIYSIAKRKDDLNKDFRDVIEKRAAYGDWESPRGAYRMSEDDLRTKDSRFGRVMDALGEHMADDPMFAAMVRNGARGLSETIGRIPGGFIGRRIEKGTDKAVEAKLKQMLLDRNLESLTQKRHYDKILAESKLDERVIDAKVGLEGLMMGIPGLMTLGGLARAMGGQPAPKTRLGQALEKAYTHVMPRSLHGAGARVLVPAALTGLTLGVGIPVAQALAKQKILTGSIGGGKNLDVGIQRYQDKLRKKMERKYKGSKEFVNEYETKQELGIDPIA